MGEYANPTGYVDTQTGQHFRDLTTNIANIVGKASTDYIGQMKANAEERKKIQEQDAEDRRRADAVALAYQADASKVANANPKINFSKTFDANLTEVGTLGLLDAKGKLNAQEKTKLNTLRLSPDGVTSFVGTFADAGTGFIENWKKTVGTTGSVDRFFNPPKLLDIFKAGTGLNPDLIETGVNSNYDDKIEQMQTSMYFNIKGQSEPLVLGDELMNQIKTKGENVILTVPASLDLGLAYNASQATIWEKTKTGKDGALVPTGVLNESFKLETPQDGKETEYKGRTIVNGVAHQDTDLTITNGKVTNSTRTYFQRNDMSKLFTKKWVDKQKEIFAESISEHELATKSIYFNVFEPQLAAMVNDKDTTEADKKAIEKIQLAFGTITKDEAKDRAPVTQDQKDMALEAHIMIQKNLLTKQYEFTPILNDDGSVKTEVVKKIAIKPIKIKSPPNPGGGNLVSVHTDPAAIEEMLNNGTSGEVAINDTKGIIKNENGVYRVETQKGDPIASGLTRDQMRAALVAAKKKKKTK
jgi:hypothetical protein